ncbi:MAG: patatin-like phospholipase family protein [Spirochaetales bacterium]|nr:patatin-like phospholipase family protein [Spirochaetales bacterium]
MFFGQTVKILSIDGGGIRGLIPLYLLKEIEKRLVIAKKHQSFCHIFDLMAGTSTGGIIALGLSCPQASSEVPGQYLNQPALTVDKLLDFYQNKGPLIFPHQMIDTIRNVTQAFQDKYQTKALNLALEETFQDTPLSSALCNILIPAFEMSMEQPFFFKKRPAKYKGRHNQDFLMRHVARATSAAPTYFRPAKISPIGDEKLEYCFVDGMIFAHNPALSAYIEARKIFPRAKKIILVSLGTGQIHQDYHYERIKKWGFLDWISPANGTPLITSMMYGQSESTHYYLSKLPRLEYIRIDDVLNYGSRAIDDATEKNITALKNQSEILIENFDREINRIVKIL